MICKKKEEIKEKEEKIVILVCGEFYVCCILGFFMLKLVLG